MVSHVSPHAANRNGTQCKVQGKKATTEEQTRKKKKTLRVFRRRARWERRHGVVTRGTANGGAGELVCDRVVDKSTREV